MSSRSLAAQVTANERKSSKARKRPNAPRWCNFLATQKSHEAALFVNRPSEDKSSLACFQFYPHDSTQCQLGRFVHCYATACLFKLPRSPQNIARRVIVLERAQFDHVLLQNSVKRPTSLTTIRSRLAPSLAKPPSADDSSCSWTRTDIRKIYKSLCTVQQHECLR